MNAKQEFLTSTANKSVLCVSMFYGDILETNKTCILKVNYTALDYEVFINSLDFNYSSGYGGQELFGTIWLKDGTWYDRGEYDGSEWWEYHKCPGIVKECC